MSQASTGLGRHEGIVCQTYTMAEVAKLFGIGRNQAYECAARNDFPTIRLGNRLVAPKPVIDKMLGIER